MIKGSFRWVFEAEQLEDCLIRVDRKILILDRLSRHFSGEKRILGGTDRFTVELMKMGVGHEYFMANDLGKSVLLKSFANKLRGDPKIQVERNLIETSKVLYPKSIQQMHYENQQKVFLKIEESIRANSLTDLLHKEAIQAGKMGKSLGYPSRIFGINEELWTLTESNRLSFTHWFKPQNTKLFEMALVLIKELFEGSSQAFEIEHESKILEGVFGLVSSSTHLSFGFGPEAMTECVKPKHFFILP